MSYYSQVAIKCEKTVYQYFHEFLVMPPFQVAKPDKILLEDDLYIIFWENIEWVEWKHPLIKKIKEVMDFIEKLPDEELDGKRFYFLRRGENIDDIEMRRNSDDVSLSMTQQICIPENVQEISLEYPKYFYVAYFIPNVTLDPPEEIIYEGKSREQVRDYFISTFDKKVKLINVRPATKEDFNPKISVHKVPDFYESNKECEKKWLLKTCYSWNDEEPDESFESFQEAWIAAMTKASAEANFVSWEEKTLISLDINSSEHFVDLHYTDGGICRYSVAEDV